MYVYRRVVRHLGPYEKIFAYYASNGKKITDAKILNYIKSLKIPPNYQEVEIDLNANADLIATGYDVKGKKQYIYNPRFVEKRTRDKICNLYDFGLQLPKILSKIRRLMKSGVETKEELIALVIAIIAKCHFRIGNPIGEREYQSRGITTITREHLKLPNNNHGKAKIEFVGKRGVLNSCQLDDPLIIANLKKLTQSTSNQIKNKRHIFSFANANGILIDINSSDVNNFLKEYGDFTSKDFRTWYGNIHFIQAMHHLTKNAPVGEELSKGKRRSIAVQAIKYTSNKLNHTPAICKKKYIVCELIEMYIENPNQFKKLILAEMQKTRDPRLTFLKYLKTYC